MDMMTRIIARASLTMSNFLNKLIRYRLIDKVKPEREMFNRLLSESRNVKKKSREWER